MKFISKLQSTKYLVIAIIAVLFAFFVVLPMLPQVDSSFDAVSFKADMVAAFGGDGGGDGPGGDGPGGAGDAGGGCCGPGGDQGGGSNDGPGGDGNTPPPAPVCTLDANPTSILNGENSTLTWTTNNVHTVSINQGIGTVVEDGNRNVSPTQTTTYTLTATGDGGTVTCEDTVTVTEPPAPVCTLDASPNSIDQGESSKLTWTTDNATQVSIDQSIGTVALDGSKDVFPTQTTTYTLTATGNGKTVTCADTVTVTQEPDAPICELFVDPNQVTLGGNARVEWDSTNVTHILITEAIEGQSETTFQDTNATQGSVVITPTATTTYEGTFTGPGGIVMCEDTVTVVPPVVEPLLCTLDTDPNSFPFGGGTTTLAWTTDNADSVSIDQGIGSVNLDGSLDRNVTNDTAFTLTATRGNETKQCVAIVDVGEEQTSPQCNSFTVTPNELSDEGTVTLEWDTSFADNVTINNGIGSVSADGSATTTVGTTTTFTLTASDGEESAQCQATVTILPPESGLSCDAFSINPGSLPRGGGDVTLSWSTTGATQVSINQGIGSVDPDGSRNVNVTESATFQLTASDGVDTVTCNTTVSVDTGGGGGGGGSSRPRCDLFEASDEVFTLGDEITLRWETRRGRELTIEEDGDEIFSTDDDDEVDEGEIEVRPDDENARYTLTVERGSRRDTCTLNINADEPDITVLSARDRQPTIIPLTDIPYTGFDAGPTLTALFYTLLALWSLAIAYVLVVKRGTVFGFALPEGNRMVHSYESVIPHREYRAQSTMTVAEPVATIPVREATPFAPHNLPIVESDETDESDDSETEEEADEDTLDADDEVLTQIENRAHAENVLLSSDVLRAVSEQGETMDEKLIVLTEVISRAKATFPREDGWIILNRERMHQLFRA